MCFGNVSKDWSMSSMKKTGLNGCGHVFSVDYDAIVVADILDIHKHLMKNNEIVLNVEICKTNIYFSNDVF